MFANTSENSSQIFKWNINSYQGVNVIPGTKVIIKPTTTTKPGGKTTSTTNPQFGTATPIVIYVNNPTKTPSFFSKISLVFVNFFQRFFSKGRS